MTNLRRSEKFQARFRCFHRLHRVNCRILWCLIGLICSAFSDAAVADIRNLQARFRAFDLDFQSAFPGRKDVLSDADRQALEKRASKDLLESLMAAEANQDHQRVVLIAEELFSKPGSLNEFESTIAGIALSATFFKMGNHRASAEICVSLGNVFNTWSDSEQVVRLGSMCSYAILKTILLWGGKAAAIHVRSFTENPVFEGAKFRRSAAAGLNALSNIILDLRSGTRNSVELERKIERSYRRVQTVSSPPLRGPNQLVWSVAALMSGHVALAQEIVSSIQNEDVYAAVALWIHARMSFDMGRETFGASLFEDSAELLIDRLRDLTAIPSPNEIEATLIGRLLLDGARAMDKAGFTPRAIITLANARSSIEGLLQKHPGLSWLSRLSDEVDLERARLMAMSQPISSQTGLATLLKMYESAFGRLKDLRDQIESRTSADKKVEALAEVARALGTRTRSVDGFTVGRKRLLDLEAREEFFNQQMHYLDFAQWSDDRADQKYLVWTRIAEDYFYDFAGSLRLEFEKIDQKSIPSSKFKDTFELLSGIFGESISHVRISAQQLEIFERPLDPRGALGPAFWGRLVGTNETRVIKDFNQVRKSLEGVYRSTSSQQTMEDMVDRMDRVLWVMALESKTGLLSGVIDLTQESKQRLEQHAIQCFEGMTRAREIVAAVLEERIRIERLRTDWKREFREQIQLAEEKRRAALEHLETISSVDSNLLVAELRAHLSARETAVKESLLHARAAGMIGQEEYLASLRSIEAYLKQAQSSLDSALRHGELR